MFKVQVEVSSRSRSNQVEVVVTVVVNQFWLKDSEIITAEIIWSLNITQSRFCLNSCDELRELLAKMFPDSSLAHNQAM